MISYQFFTLISLLYTTHGILISIYFYSRWEIPYSWFMSNIKLKKFMFLTLIDALSLIPIKSNTFLIIYLHFLNISLKHGIREVNPWLFHMDWLLVYERDQFGTISLVLMDADVVFVWICVWLVLWGAVFVFLYICCIFVVGYFLECYLGVASYIYGWTINVYVWNIQT